MASDTRELLAMMTPHGVKVDGTLGGGKPTLTALDVAGAMGLGRLTRRQALLLLVKYCDERHLKHELWVIWFKHVWAKGQSWDVEPSQIRLVTDISLDECIGTNVCSACRGTMFVMLNQKRLDCALCNGTGRRYASERRMAAGFRCSRRQYRQVWEPRMRWAHQTLQSWESQAVDRIAKNLG